jgi:hypothetical protein
MDIQDLGSLGELLAALATIATLVYLAVQVRQNTRALTSSTFQAISNDMSISSEAISTHPDLADVFFRGRCSLDELSPAERLQFSFFLLMTVRRLESLFIQSKMGFVGSELTEGFERSVISVIAGDGGGAQWWRVSKDAFSSEFAAYVDAKLQSEQFPQIHPGVGGSKPA